MNTNNKRARMAGFLYLLYMIVAISSDLWRDSFIVLGDAAATAKNIMANEWLFTMTAVGDLVTAALFFLTAWALYVLLKPVNKNLAVLLMLLNLAGVAVHFTSGLNLFAALLLLDGPHYLNVFQPDQLQALALFFLDLQHKGFLMAQLFYGLWLFPLGYTGLQVGLPAQSLGHRADGSLLHLDVKLLSGLPLPRLRSATLRKLAAGIHCGSRAYSVASDYGRQGSETCVT